MENSFISVTVSVSIVGYCGVSVQGKLKLLKFLAITFYGVFGHSLMYHILLFFTWLLSLSVCIICCIIDFQVCKTLNHDSVLVRSAFKGSVESCSYFIGYNFLYGLYHSIVYNDHEWFCSQVL